MNIVANPMADSKAKKKIVKLHLVWTENIETMYIWNTSQAKRGELKMAIQANEKKME